MKLELKHINPYANEGLFGLFNGVKDIVTSIDYENSIITSLNNGLVLIEDFIPILRLFSSLTKEDLSLFSVNFRIYYKREDFNYKKMLVSDFELANKLHLDYRFLIEKGLAIDKNTIK